MEKNINEVQETVEEVIEIKEKKKFFTKKKLLLIGGSAAALLLGAFVLTRKGGNSGSITEALPESNFLEDVSETVSNLSEEA